MNNRPMNHLAMILDGNRRWGKQRGIAMSTKFYIESGLLGKDIIQAAFDRGINNLTVWIGSVSNLTKRSALELKALNIAYRKFFSDRQNIDFAHDRQIKIDCFGRWRELLETDTVKAIEQAIDETARYATSDKRLTVLVGYDGKDERGAAMQKILKKIAGINSSDEAQRRDLFEKELPLSSKDSASAADTLRQNSWTGHLPDVDLIIRTGCAADPHNSAGFLSLLVDNAQYAFLDTLWPDFTPVLLDQVIDNFSQRERRLGK